MGWWWPHSSQRPVAWWPVKSPRKWFRGASWEEPPSQRRCFMNLKILFNDAQINSQRSNMMRNHIWDSLLKRVGFRVLTHDQCMFLYVCVCVWDSATKKDCMEWIDGERWPFSYVCYKLWPLSSFYYFQSFFIVASDVFNFSFFHWADDLVFSSTPSVGSDLVTHTWALNQGQHGPVIWLRLSNPKWPCSLVSCPPPTAFPRCFVHVRAVSG